MKIDSSLLRSRFYVYKGAENQLTNALIQTLASSPRLLSDFLSWAGVRPPPGLDRYVLSSQVMPGEPAVLQVPPDGDERRSVPDGWICNPRRGWALLIESKVTAALRPAQLRRHLETAKRLEFADHQLLVLSEGFVCPPAVKRLQREGRPVLWKGWPGLYTWLTRNGKFPYARDLVTYLELLESDLREDKQEVSLTEFSGINFRTNGRYSYPEAKRMLHSVLDLLVQSKGLLRLYRHVRRSGRPIHDEPAGVWDVVLLGERAVTGKSAFTQNPHLTLWIGIEDTALYLTIPDGAKQAWRTTRSVDPVELRQLIADFHASVRANAPVLDVTAKKRIREPQVLVRLQHRHWHHLSRPAVDDARLEVAWDAVVDDGEAKLDPGSKDWTPWADAFMKALVQIPADRNVEFAVGVRYQYLPGSIVHRPELVAQLVSIAAALYPPWKRLSGVRA